LFSKITYLLTSSSSSSSDHYATKINLVFTSKTIQQIYMEKGIHSQKGTYRRKKKRFFCSNRNNRNGDVWFCWIYI